MYSLSQSHRVKGAAGEPIPSPFRGLADLDVEFRRGEFSLIAAGPGTGKSLFALNLAMYGNVPCYYWSADSGVATQLSRATAIITGDNVGRVKTKLLKGDFGEYESALGKRWWVRFSYEAKPTIEEMETELAAYYEVFGCMPHLCVIDNISNVDGGVPFGDADSYVFGLEGLCGYLNDMARVTQAHVLALHHVTGEYSDGLKPIPLSGVRGKIGGVPSLVLTIHKEADGTTLNVSPVKNREGRADPSGETYASFALNTENLRLTDIEKPFV